MEAICFSLRKLAGSERARFIALGLIAVLAGDASSKLFAAPQGIHEQRQEQSAPVQVLEHEATTPAPLAMLIEEARKNDPAILAAERAAKAATFVAPQVSTLPDPQFTVQQFSVGSPRPFAGYTNSEFAYVGLGASQQLPYPGKLKLRGAVADRDADTAKAHTEVVLQDEIETLKTTYFHLSYLQQTLGVLQRNATLLQQMEQQAEARYSIGQGNQQDVLKAQLILVPVLFALMKERAPRRGTSPPN